jgi:hypothetical protein
MISMDEVILIEHWALKGKKKKNQKNKGKANAALT